MFAECRQLHGFAFDRCMVRVRRSDRHGQICPIVALQDSENGRLGWVRTRVFRFIGRVELILIAGGRKKLGDAAQVSQEEGRLNLAEGYKSFDVRFENGTLAAPAPERLVYMRVDTSRCDFPDQVCSSTTQSIDEETCERAPL